MLSGPPASLARVMSRRMTSVGDRSAADSVCLITESGTTLVRPSEVIRYRSPGWASSSDRSAVPAIRACSSGSPDRAISAADAPTARSSRERCGCDIASSGVSRPASIIDWATEWSWVSWNRPPSRNR